MRLWKKGCIFCGGDIYLDYKGGTRWKCLKCSRIFLPPKEIIEYDKE